MVLIDRFKLIRKSVCKNNMSSYFLVFFFILSFLIVIPLVYIKKIFTSVFIDVYSKRLYILLVKFIAIYQRKNFISIFISICQFSGSILKKHKFISKLNQRQIYFISPSPCFQSNVFVHSIKYCVRLLTKYKKFPFTKTSQPLSTLIQGSESMVSMVP